MTPLDAAAQCRLTTGTVLTGHSKWSARQDGRSVSFNPAHGIPAPKGGIGERVTSSVSTPHPAHTPDTQGKHHLSPCHSPGLQGPSSLPGHRT